MTEISIWDKSEAIVQRRKKNVLLREVEGSSGRLIMNTLEAIKTRRSTRKFQQKLVEREKLEQIVEAGRFGPTGGNAQSNHFFVISDATVIAKLKELVQSAFAAMELRDDLYKSLKNSIMLSRKGNYSFCYTAPVLIVVANKKEYGNNMADVACVAIGYAYTESVLTNWT